LKTKKKTFLAKSIVLIFIISMLFSCKDKISVIDSVFPFEDSIPEMIAKNIDYLESDSGKVLVSLTSPTMNKYSGKNSLVEFPDGFKVVFYDSAMNIKSQMSADYGINLEKKRLMEAKKNVIIINYENHEILFTEHITWDQKKKTIFSDVPIKIITKSDTIYGQGFESDETFSHREIIKPTGVFVVEQEEEK